MEYQNLLVQEAAGIVLLTIQREAALNALNAATMAELGYAFGEDFPQRAGLTGVIITGAGEKAFVAGADIKGFLGLDAAKGQELAAQGQAVFALIERSKFPVIAAINGFALGGGCELALACHLRIAGEKARFGQPEVNLGLIPGYGGTQRLIQCIGKTKAMELILTAAMIDAAEALRLGLVNQVVPAGTEVDAARKMLQVIASKGPIAVAQSIAAINAFFDKTVDGFAFEAAAFGLTAGTADFREGASAFVEKRTPQFKGS